MGAYRAAILASAWVRLSEVLMGRVGRLACGRRALGQRGRVCLPRIAIARIGLFDAVRRSPAVGLP